MKGERNAKSQRENIEGKIFFHSIERGGDSTKLNLFELFRAAAYLETLSVD